MIMSNLQFNRKCGTRQSTPVFYNGIWCFRHANNWIWGRGEGASTWKHHFTDWHLTWLNYVVRRPPFSFRTSKSFKSCLTKKMAASTCFMQKIIIVRILWIRHLAKFGCHIAKIGKHIECASLINCMYVLKLNFTHLTLWAPMGTSWQLFRIFCSFQWWWSQYAQSAH